MYISSSQKLSPSYDQALNEFGIISLVQKLNQLTQSYYSQTKLEQLAKLLIQQLTNSLSCEWIDAYLNVIEKGQPQTISHLLSVSQHLPLPSDNPSFFLDADKPMYGNGKLVQWRLLEAEELTDWGIVMGRFYGYSPENACWQWCYLVLLDLDSPSANWCTVDTAWEQDLELFYDE